MEDNTLQNITNGASMTNATTDATEGWKRIVLGFCMYSLVLVTVAANILVLVAVYVEKKLQTTFNYYIVNLAITDAVVAVNAMFMFTTNTVLGYWPFGKVMCAIWIFCDYYMTFVSIFTLLLISIDRVLSVTWTMQYRQYHTKKKCCISIGIIWVLTLALWLPACIHDRIKNSTDDKCIWEPALNRICAIIIAVLAYHGSVLIMIFCYIRVLVGIRGSKKKLYGHRDVIITQGSLSQLQKAHTVDTNSIAVQQSDQKQEYLPKEVAKNDATSPDARITKKSTIEHHRPYETLKIDTLTKGNAKARTGNVEAIHSIRTSDIATSVNTTVPGSMPATTRPYPNDIKEIQLLKYVETGNQDRKVIMADILGKRPQPSKMAENSKCLRSLSASRKHNNRRETKTVNFRQRQERRIFITLTYIVIGYIVCWCPFHVVFDIRCVDRKLVPELVYTVTYFFPYINSTINPILYTCSSSLFREVFLRLLCRRSKSC